MAARQHSDLCAFDNLFSRNLPNILEKIFFYLDYASFKTCSDVNTTWKNLLTSKPIVKKARSKFKREIKRIENKRLSPNKRVVGTKLYVLALYLLSKIGP